MLEHDLLDRWVVSNVHHCALVVAKELFKHSDLEVVGLALGRELVKLSALAFMPFFDDLTLAREQFVGMLELVDELLHFFFLELETTDLLYQ